MRAGVPQPPRRRHGQRVDGFVSAAFDALGARCVTQPVRVSGSRLLLNVDNGALGTLRVALLDAATREPIAGYELDACKPRRTNSVRAATLWNGNDDLTPLVGREVRLEFVGERTKLSSFYFDSTFAFDTPRTENVK